MDDEIEDIVGDVQYTDSQKSVAASNVYSMEFTDSSSDKNNSSGKETYVLEMCDSEESDFCPIKSDKSVIYLKDYKPNRRDADVQCDNDNISKAASTSLQNCSIFAQEIFTQTSKTIFELAQAERADKEHLETQTSHVTITENRTVAYSIQYNINTVSNLENEVHTSNEYPSITQYNFPDEESSMCPISDSDTIKSDGISEVSSDDRILNIINDESNENFLSIENGDQNSEENISAFRQNKNASDSEGTNSDIDEDSLMELGKSKTDNNSDTSEVPVSVDEDVEELYNRLSESIDITMEKPYETERLFSPLTPLTEESTIKRESLLDITPTDKIYSVGESDVLFTNNCGVKIKMLPNEQETFKLPPIQISNRSNASSPHLNFLFSLQTAKALPDMYEETGRPDQWDNDSKNMGSGESPLISGKSDSSKGNIHLPPIHIEGYVVNRVVSRNESELPNQRKINSCENAQDSISITEKIKELKNCNKNGRYPRSRYTPSKASDSRSGSPSELHTENRLSDISEKGCEVLCAELVRRLRSASWFEVADTLEDVPKVLNRFWGIIAEFRIADLIRQITLHVDSPRTHVARAACASLAAVVKNTKYTKKPDFYEAVTQLLTKTGSFCHPVRRAANVALDEIVCGVELTHAVTALCIHGVDHKSPLVRCAAGRLLVVSSALAGGGRGVLRARPPSAAHARTHVLRSLATLLDDKNTDTRKYAERLYVMLRPLPNFEAYYLTDVDVETATRQMKKYDKLLTNRQTS